MNVLQILKKLNTGFFVVFSFANVFVSFTFFNSGNIKKRKTTVITARAEEIIKGKEKLSSFKVPIVKVVPENKFPIRGPATAPKLLILIKEAMPLPLFSSVVLSAIYALEAVKKAAENKPASNRKK